MKNILRGLAAGVIILGTSGVGAQVGAVECDSAIEDTGPGSHNEIECDTSTKIKVKCVNNIYVKVDNDQDADSGDAEVDGNTYGGNASSGDAVNVNDTDIKVGASCGEAAPVTEVPGGGSGGGGGNEVEVTPASSQSTSAASAPVAGGMVAAGGAGAAAEVEMLPETSGDSTVAIGLLSATILAGIVGASRLSSSFRRQLTWQPMLTGVDRAKSWLLALINR